MSTNRPKRPRDVNQLAKAIVDESVGDTPRPEPEPDVRNPHALALGAKGWSKGGRARAEKLSAEQRREIARNAANRRWAASTNKGTP
jgi:hypothetical protein